MRKNAAFAVKIGVDTADILAFWAWNEFWYFDCILVFWPSANSKRKCEHFTLELSGQEWEGMEPEVSSETESIGVPPALEKETGKGKRKKEKYKEKRAKRITEKN